MRTFSLVLLVWSPLVGAPAAFPGFKDIDQRKNSFIVVGDTQRTSNWEFWRERNFSETQSLLAEIARRNPAFVIHVGDLTARGSSEKHWEYFDQWHRPILDRKIPYFPVAGNHEYYGSDTTALNHFFARFPHLDRATWYSMRFKNVGCIMLNSNFGALDRDAVARQDAWYLKELMAMERDAEIAFILVCCHQPPYTNGTVMPRSVEVERRFAEPFLAAKKTALFMSGHCHSYERFLKNGKSFVVTGGGGGPRHRLEADENRRKFADEFAGPALRPFHFCEIAVGEKLLELKVIALKEDKTFAEMDRATVARK
jgi:hypothetical protein